MDLTRRETMGAIGAGAAVLSAAAGAQVPSAARHQRLWYRQPAAKWTEALPLGNGRVAAMVFGGVERERLQFNEGTLWAGQPYDPVNPRARAALPEVRRLVFDGQIAAAEKLINEALLSPNKVQMPYQVLGDLTLDFPGLGAAEGYERELDLDAAMATTRFRSGGAGHVRRAAAIAAAEGYERELDLDAAMATTRFRSGGAGHVRRAVASLPDQVIAVRLEAPRGKLDVDMGLTSPQAGVAVRGDGAAGLLMTGRNGDAAGVKGGLRFAARLAARAEGGRTTTTDGKLSVRGANAVTILIAMATSFRRFDDISGDPEALTQATLAKVGAKRFDRIAADAAAAHRRQFRRVALNLGRTPAADQPTDRRIAASQTSDDPALAALYFDYGRYLMISCSQPGGQAATLQGLWNDSLTPPWQSKYTININTEMNYWPVHSANLSECAAPLVQMVRDLAERGEKTAREMYGARGWVVHHNTDIWRATAPIDGAQWGMWPTGGAWLCTHLWEAWEYGRDRAFLASIYPLMAGSARFFLDTLQRDPQTGFLVTNPSISPENQHGHGGAVAAGPTMDMAILRDLFDQTAAAAELLGRDAPFVAEMRAARARLAPYKVSRRGELQEWQADWDADAPEQDHRHVSHLYGVYPSRQIDPARTPELAAAAKRTLDRRGDRTTGWAIAWRINLWARLRDGDRAHSILKLLLAPERTYPNMFDAHPPFQIDGNFGGAAAVIEMLMSSEGDRIDLLPALPRAWPSGEVRGLRARGRCTVDVAWAGGRLTRAVLRSEVGGERTVVVGGQPRTVRLTAGRPFTVTA